jgi:hypothetical protein
MRANALQKNPDKLKKIYLLAAMEMKAALTAKKNGNKSNLLGGNNGKNNGGNNNSGPGGGLNLGAKQLGGGSGNTDFLNNQVSALTDLMDVGAGGGKTGNTGSNSNQISPSDDVSKLSDAALSKPWRGCEAYHLYLLCQRQIHNSEFEMGMRTALRLCDYEEFLDVETIYSLVS